ncbi:Sphingosine N-acyltransferase lag1 [Pseudocercospora fuligena]|uniref:Sphingosine N-acyltransferase lag1 n=1 Tax=Pseudocercospora fuligena TaxID=685502 RepID=A0A8H6RSD7_9PEZI|nr:Sphingosine N-acyltransferase lag1 [Pseudocercospora fuligena]
MALKAGPPERSPPSPTKIRNTPPPHKGYSVEEVAVCASPGDFTASPPKRRTTWPPSDQQSVGEALRLAVERHQLGLSLNYVLFLGMSFMLFPSLRHNIKACFLLSYPTEVSGQYGIGPRDIYLVGSFIIYFTGFRAFMMDYALIPLAGYCGLRRKAKTRFAEQAYMLVYYVIYWFWGLALFVRDTPADVQSLEDLLVSLWTNFPRLLMPGGIKMYYLTQSAFWFQQIVVIHLEERRKDHYQMLTHHFVTVGLMVGSYCYRQYRVGCAILVCMDIVDLVLPLAKILRYLGMQTACDCAFGVFVLTWIAARHVAYNTICWSIYAHVNSKAMPYGVYSTITGQRLSTDGGNKILQSLLQPMLDPGATTIAFNANIRWSFLGLLSALQVITIGWLIMIIRVVVRVLSGQGADDSRSDDEEDDEDEEIENGPPQPSEPIRAPEEVEKPQFIEVETTSEELSWSTRKASSVNGHRKKPKGISSGLNLGEHKEILNRIGCLSEEQLAREREKREDSASPRPPSARP